MGLLGARWNVSYVMGKDESLEVRVTSPSLKS
jgi:hypothetical protein